MGKLKTLILFTGEFPYGRVGEPFLNDEIFYLSKYFDRIIILPRKCSASEVRKLPENAEVDNILQIDNLRLRNANLFFLLRILFFFIRHGLLSKNAIKYIRFYKHFLYKINEALVMEGILREKYSEQLKQKNTLLYSYWFDNSLLAACILKKNRIAKKTVSRIHGFDLYDNRNIGGLVPFREFKTKQCDAIFAISKNGKNYFLNRIRKKHQKKVFLSYLGVKNNDKFVNKHSGHTTPLIVSCARVESFKRIELIAKALYKIDKPIKWIHFGDGTYLNQIKEHTKDFPDYINIEFKGQVHNQEVLDFYKNNYVDLFISASESEGLPVTMMEAQSFGIPIVAYNVGGISEIVLDGENGFLVQNVNDFDTFVQSIKRALFEYKFDRKKIRAFFGQHFDASINYEGFAKELSCLLEK